MNIAILKYNTENLGDDLQRIALEELLPRVDIRIDRDDLGPAQELEADDLLIVNGWFSSGRHRVWPIRTKAKILYTGFHANDLAIVPKTTDLPIGCRDGWTYSLCRRKNVPAWMSWCATLTLRRSEPAERNGIYFVDLPEKFLSSIPSEIVGQSVRVSHFVEEGTDRDVEAKKRLELYSRAKLVVTNRLHAMLPCLALGTPVVLAPLPYQSYRATSYLHLAWTLENAPWFEMKPKTSREEIFGMTLSFRKTLDHFLNQKEQSTQSTKKKMNDFGFFAIGQSNEPGGDTNLTDPKENVLKRNDLNQPIQFGTNSPSDWKVTIRKTTEVSGIVFESSCHEQNVDVKFWVSGNFVGQVRSSGGTTSKMTLEPGEYRFETQTTDEKIVRSYWKFQPSPSGNVQ